MAKKIFDTFESAESEAASSPPSDRDSEQSAFRGVAETTAPLPTFEEIEAYWQSGRTPEEAAQVMAAHSIITDDRIVYYLPGQEEQARSVASIK